MPYGVQWWDLISGVTGVGQLLYSRLAMSQAESLHRREIAANMASHFQVLSQDLFAAAKEADRDVWEQYNGRFNNLMVLTVLMLSVTSSLITEGTFESGHSAMAWEHLFILATAMGVALFFGSLAASIRATRDMSDVMSDRSAVLEERIIQLASRNKLSAGMQALYRKIDSSGKREARAVHNVAYVPTRAALCDEVLQATCESLREVPRDEGSARGRMPSDDGMRFFDFVTHHIKWLEQLATRCFVGGTACSLIALAVLVHNQFSSEKLIATIIFAVVGLGGGALSALLIFRTDRPHPAVLSPSRSISTGESSRWHASE